MVQLTNTIELETEAEVAEPIEVVEATQATETANPVEVLKIVNLMELIKDRTQFSYCLKIIADDDSLTPTNKSFLTMVANIGIERGTSEIVTDDIEIAAKFNRNPRTVRRWITRSIALGKISRHIIDYGTGKYCIRFLHNFLTNLSESQYLTAKVDTSLCPTKPTNTRGRKPKTIANNENTIIDQINNQNTSASLEAPAATPATSLQPPTTITTPHLALAAPGQAESSTSQNLTPLMQSFISSSTPLPTDKMLEQLSQASNKIEPNLATLNNQTKVTSINSIKSTKSIASTSPNKNFIGVPRTATFGNLLIAQKEAPVSEPQIEQELEQQIEEAENLVCELTDEQEDLILSITGSIQKYWQKTNKINELETKWKGSKSKTSFDDFLNEQSIIEANLLYREQYLNFTTTNTKENAIELSLASLLEKWESIILPEVTTPPTIPLRTQANTSPNIIIKPSIQDIICVIPEITPEIITSSLDSFSQSEINLKPVTESLALDTTDQSSFLENVGQSNNPALPDSIKNIINENVVSDALTNQPTLDSFNQSAISQHHQNSASQSLDTTDQTTINDHLIDLNLNKPSQQPTLDNSDQTTNQISQPSLDTFNQNPLPNSKNDLANTVQSATNADNKSSNGSQNVAKDSVSPNSLKGDCFGQHCPTFNSTSLISSTTPNILSNSNGGTDNNTSFTAISSLLPATYSTDTPTSTISTSGDNMPSATTVPNSSNDTTPFKALKLSSFLDLDHDLKEKEEKKSFKASLTVSGTNNNSGTDASSTSMTANNSTSSYAAIQKAKILSDLGATFGHRPSEVETVTRGDENCVYCVGEGKLYKIASVLVSTNKGDKWETFRDQEFIPCQCGKLYDMLEFVYGNVVVVGIPKLTQEQLVMQQHLICAIDEKLKAKGIFNQQNSSNSVQPQPNKQPAQQPKIQAKPQVKVQAQQPKSQPKNSVDSSKQIESNTASNAVSDTPNAENNNKANEDKNNKPAKNYNVERVPLNNQMLCVIKKLNAKAHERLDDEGNQDIVIKTTKKEDFCIVPNPCKQFRKSEFSFLEWLLYAAREPNRTLPVRMACQRYYVGKKDAEMVTWKQQRAELGVGGSLEAGTMSNNIE